MHAKLEVFVEDQHSESAATDIITLDKAVDGAGLLGLLLNESKRLLKTLQQIIVRTHAEAYTKAHICCPD
ncbi:MAG: hypothetical protein AAGA91_20350 [Pseudomonadota bacterium]